MAPSAVSSSSSYYSSSSEDSDSEYPDEVETPALASTTTLVHTPPPLHLMFSRNSVTHATLCSSAGPLYRIHTHNKLTRTDLVDLREERERVVAAIKRRDFLPDVVVFAHRREKSVRISRWLQQLKPFNGRYILHTLCGHFVWRSDSTYRLALYRENQIDSPIAYYKEIEDPPTLALVLHPGFEHIRVEIVTSFIVLEHRLRLSEKVRQGEMEFGTSSNGVLFVAGY